MRSYTEAEYMGMPQAVNVPRDAVGISVVTANAADGFDPQVILRCDRNKKAMENAHPDTI